MNNETLAVYLKKAGYSMTNSRREVFNLLADKAPLTMHAIWKQLEGSTDRSSIYRTVSLFERLGIIQRINRGWKYTLELTDAFVPHHHHFTCTNCSKVINFEEPTKLDSVLNELASHNDFEIKSHTLEVAGLCKDCRTS